MTSNAPPNISSALINESRTRATSARLSPATSQPPRKDSARTANVERLRSSELLPTFHFIAGRRGASAVNAVGIPTDETFHTKVGTSPASNSLVFVSEGVVMDRGGRPSPL